MVGLRRPGTVTGMDDPVLRRLREDDAADVLAAFASAPDMTRQGPVTDLDNAIDYVQRLSALGGPHLAFAITVADRTVGLVGITVDPRNRNGWFWYWLHAGYRGRGWGSRAAATIADWALDAGGLERLELGHRVDNPASKSVALAAGFVREGLERDKLVVDGDRVDVIAYGRLPTDPRPAYDPLPLKV